MAKRARTNARGRRLAGLVAGLTLGGAAAQAQGLLMLDQLEAGAWELRMRDPAAPPQRLCIASGRHLLQLRHPDQTCAQHVLRDGPAEVTVHYTCRGSGYGFTHIRRETSRLVQIESQGVVNGQPFEFSAEARRSGLCGR